MLTYWKCERCGDTGTARYAKGDSVYNVIDKLREAHHRRTRAGCIFDVHEVRVSETPFTGPPPATTGTAYVEVPHA